MREERFQRWRASDCGQHREARPLKNERDVSLFSDYQSTSDTVLQYRARHALKETSDATEERFQQRTVRAQHRCAMETPEGREARLRLLRTAQHRGGDSNLKVRMPVVLYCTLTAKSEVNLYLWNNYVTVRECKKSRSKAVKLFMVCKSGGGGLGSLMLKFGGSEHPLPPHFSAPATAAAGG